MNANAIKEGGMRKGAITGGALGSLDVGWLNSRNDNVGKEMEAELWEEAQQLVENAESRIGLQNAMQQRDNEGMLNIEGRQKSNDTGELDQS